MRNLTAFLLLLCFFCSHTVSFGQQVKNYEHEWTRVNDLLVQKNLPKSALQEVQKIYALAKKDKQEAQIIKALIYIVGLQQENRENNQTLAIKEIEKEIALNKEPAVSILKSLSAELYLQYFYQHRWQLYDRTNTDGFNSEDITKWSTDDFHKKISKLYLKSLSDESLLKQTRLEPFDAIIIKGNTRVLRPTLYDLLAQKALDYFKSSERDIKKVAYSYEIQEPEAFAPAASFAEAKFVTKDSLSLHQKALLIYLDLIKFHLPDAKPDALIDVDIDRIEFVYQNSIAENKKELYQAALKNLINSYGNQPAVVQAKFLLAAHYNQLANQYDPLKDTSYRYERLKAKEILEDVVKDSLSKSEGWTNSYNLLKEVTKQSFSFETESVNVPGKPFRALVRYKNIAALNLRLIKSTQGLQEALQRDYQKYWRLLTEAPTIRTWQQTLPQTNDLQQHSVEIKIDELPVGEYILLASSDPNFLTPKNLLGARKFYVSNISYLNKGQRFFVANRESGQPLAKASVEVFTQQYDYKTSRQIKQSVGRYKTDKNGFFSVPTKKETNYGGYFLDIKYEQDRLFIDEPTYHYYYSDTEDEEDGEDAPKKIFFFTDRSIYRPGQTVYFKGIVLQQKKKGHEIVINYEDEIFLEDVNGQDVDSVEITTNEFGSFSGKFVLPENSLNGEFRIYDDEDDNEINISVEEYKRPKFYVDFDKLKNSYKVGDSIAITGNAKAYAGNSISNAKVVYRVVRHGRFIYPWLFRNKWLPTVQPMEIAHGEATTNATGQFSILFKAIPDASINKEFDPVFDYRIYADVTDLNGETRSGEQLISAGYKSLLLSMNIAERISLDSLKSIVLRTTNMSGEFLPSMVTLTASKLVPENRLIRNRYWQQPDQFVMNKTEFIQQFPNDEYVNESDYKNWQRGKAVFSKTDSSRNSALFTIDNSKFTVGFYVLEAVTKDANGQEVKNIRYFEVYDPKSNALIKPQYLWASAGNKSVAPGEQATIQMGSSANNIFLVHEISNTETKEQVSFNRLNNEKKTFHFTPKEEDRGGFGVSYFFIKDNRVYQYNDIINVPWTNKELKIEYSSYRDKTLPGSQEKWSVKISGSKNEHAAAEVLTSMYDASLDQFKPHDWSSPAVWPYYVMRNFWNSRQNFLAVQSTLRDFDQNDYKYFDKRYDQLSFNAYQISRRAMLSKGNPVREQNMAADSNISALQGRAAGVSIAGVPTQQNLDEVVVVGYGIQKKTMTTGSIAIRGANSLPNGSVLYVVDGVVSSTNPNLEQDNITTMSVLTGAEAVALYGSQAANGVVVITTKQGLQKLPSEEVTTRKNFNETAFFFPDLRTDKEGNIEFSFTMPEALTKWKMQTLAHTKDLAFGLSSKEIVTQKDLMVQPNMPRFLREGDRIELSAKIVNLSNKELTGQAELQLLDATTNQPVDGWFQNIFPNQYFTAAAGSSEAVKFPIEVPFNFSKALIWRIVARSGNYSDGEEAALPVLTNKMLVTESLALPMRGIGTKNFMFEKLAKAENSETLKHHALTVEYTSNPAWYAVQALPYLMEYPYECAEQTWNRYYANALAAKIVNTAPRIKQIFEQWKTKDTAALISNLQKNEELKSVLLEETPWVLQAKNEEAQKKNIALLFDLVCLGKEMKKNLEQLKQMQSENGGFVWLKGGPDDRYITQYILTGLGHLKKLGALPDSEQKIINQIEIKALRYLDTKITEDYLQLQKRTIDLKQNNIGYIQVQYLYMRSFYSLQVNDQTTLAIKYYTSQARQYWMKQNKYMQGMIALALSRAGDFTTAKNILASLKETAVQDKELGMYWKDNSFGRGWFWHQAPIETQALLIEAFNEIDKDTTTVNDLKSWLVKNKQTNNWQTSKATAEACYALLLQGTDWLNNEPDVTIKLGSTVIASTEQKTEAGTGYFKKSIEGELVTPDMANVSVTVQTRNKQATSNVSWGAVYWQYFEDLDKITPAQTPLQLTKKLFIEKNTDRGLVLTPVEEGTQLKVGDKIKVRIELKADRDMEYVHMKDMRASALEPVNVLSGYKWQGGLGYYESTKDASTSFFFSHLRKGSYVFEYPLFINQAGNFSNGVTTIQCMYAPEFNAHSEGVRINVQP